MKSDAFFVKGQSHNICQDYAIARDNIIAISDGCSLINDNGKCSKHPNSDIAARLVCLAVLNKCGFPTLTHLRDTLGVGIDATMTSVVHENDMTEITRIGDGVIFLEFKDRSKNIITLKFEPNTPVYVSYFLSDKAKEKYISQNVIATETFYQIGENWTVISVSSDIDSHSTSVQPRVYKFLRSDNLKSISIFSDGILDIQGPDGRLDVVDAIRALTSFKRTNGEFVLARMKSQLRYWADKGIFQNDDLSMATLILE